MGCAIGTVRYILFFCNFILALAGLCVLVLGIVTARSEDTSFSDVVHGQLTTPAVIFSIVGACVFVFAFFGCCGALRDSHCMVCTYAVMLLTLFLLQVVVAVLAYKYKAETKDVISQGIEMQFMKYNTDNGTHTWVDTVQQKLECCGSSDTNTPWNTLGMSKPASCFPKNDITKTAFNTACITDMIEIVDNSLSTISNVAIIVAIVQVVGIVFSLCLANSIKRSDRRSYS